MTMKQPVRPTPALRGQIRPSVAPRVRRTGCSGRARLPAVDHDGACVWRVAGLDSPQESQEWGRVLRHPVVWPCRELELADLAFLTGAVLGGHRDTACQHSPPPTRRGRPAHASRSQCPECQAACPAAPGHGERGSPWAPHTQRGQHRALSPQTCSHSSSQGWLHPSEALNVGLTSLPPHLTHLPVGGVGSAFRIYPDPSISHSHLGGHPDSPPSPPIQTRLVPSAHPLWSAFPTAATRGQPGAPESSPLPGVKAQDLPARHQALHDLPRPLPALPSSTSRTLLQPHGPPHCSSSIPGTVLPQSLCTSHSR